MSKQKTCPECNQPMLADGQQRQHEDDYRHASGCPNDDTICNHCDGAGVISYNQNLNPNSFSGMAVATCGRCNGAGREAAE